MLWHPSRVVIVRIRRRLVRLYAVGKPGQRDYDVEAWWSRWEGWFSTLVFRPTLRVKVTPRGSDFNAGSVGLELRPTSARASGRGDDEAEWVDADGEWIPDTWTVGKSRRFTFRVPPGVLPGSGAGAYQCRLNLHEVEDVGDGYAILTDSHFYLRDPIRVHDAGTGVSLIAAAIALAGALLSVAAALLAAS